MNPLVGKLGVLWTYRGLNDSVGVVGFWIWTSGKSFEETRGKWELKTW